MIENLSTQQSFYYSSIGIVKFSLLEACLETDPAQMKAL